MKSEQARMKSSAQEPQMKLNPPRPTPREAGFHREVISSTEGGFIPPKADLVEKKHCVSSAFFLAEMERFTNSCVREYAVRKCNFCYAHAIASLRGKLAELCISSTSRTKNGIAKAIPFLLAEMERFELSRRLPDLHP